MSGLMSGLKLDEGSAGQGLGAFHNATESAGGSFATTPVKRLAQELRTHRLRRLPRT
jgi:hypothetical protein